MGGGVRSDKLINPRGGDGRSATPISWGVACRAGGNGGVRPRGRGDREAARKGTSGRGTYPDSGSRSHHLGDWVASSGGGAAAPAAPPKRRPRPGPEPETAAAAAGRRRRRDGGGGESPSRD